MRLVTGVLFQPAFEEAVIAQMVFVIEFSYGFRVLM